MSLFSGELKHEVFWEALKVALHRLVEVEGLDAVKISKVGVKHNLVATDQKIRLSIISTGIGRFSEAERFTFGAMRSKG